MHIKKWLFIALICIVLKSDSFVNWAGNLTCFAPSVIKPTHKDELINAVRRAYEKREKMHVIGSRHSWSEILCGDEGIVIDMTSLNGIIAFDVKQKTITVQAGITLQNMVSFLAQNNLAMPNQPAILDQTIAGACATGTHGTGDTGTLANFIESIEIILPDGSMVHASGNQNEDIFKAATVNVGVCGIVYSLTLRCIDRYVVQRIVEVVTWDKVKNNILTLFDEKPQLSIFWQPQENKVTIETREPINDVPHESWFQTVSKHSKNMFLHATTYITDWFPALANVMSRTWVSHVQNENSIMYIDEALSGPVGIRYLEEEIAIPRARVPEAIKKLEAVIRKFQKKNIDGAGITLRSVRADTTSFLSPTAGRDVVYFSVITATKPDKYMPLFKEIYKVLIPLEGRPHWGKINFLTDDELIRMYGKNIEEFRKVRDILDPDRLFVNSWYEKVFKPVTTQNHSQPSKKIELLLRQ